MKLKLAVAVVAVLSLLRPAPASAALTTFQTFVGNVGVSTDGYGSNSGTPGVISADVPVGATVLAAYLYTATVGTPASFPVTLAGNPVAFGARVDNATACCGIGSARGDVTSIIAPLINGGPGGVYNFAINEGNTLAQDGEALVVVYSLASIPVSTVGILDGFASVSGDSTAINFTNPLDTSAPGFFAEMRLGIGFSCCGIQSSTVRVNGTLITANAGNDDDTGVDQNGQLITVGGFDDPFSPLLPSYAADHERYNLVPQIANGSTSISVVTANASADDNIFLAAFYVSGIAGVNAPPPDGGPAAVPEPATLSLLGLGMAAAWRRRKAQK